MSDDPLEATPIDGPPEDRIALALEGIEQLAHRMADVIAACEGVARRIDRVADRLTEIERRLDEEMLRRIESAPLPEPSRG